MSRMIFAAICAAALLLVTSVAGAEESAPGRPARLSADDRADAPAVDAGGDLAAARPADEAAGASDAEAGPDFEPLTEDELAVLEEAAARNPELADKAGGYVSNEELLTILLVVVIVVLII